MEYNLYQKGFLRFPVLDIKQLEDLLKKIDDDDFSFLDNNHLLDPIHLANSDFITLLNDRKGSYDKKILISLAKYLTRMSTDCTPFGLFAGCSIVNFGTSTELIEDKSYSHTIVARLNFSTFFRIYELLEKKYLVREKSNFIINPTVHHFEYNNSIRFLKFTFQHDSREIKFELYEIESDLYLENFIKNRTIVSYQDLLDSLLDDDVDRLSAVQYLNTLVDVGFFVNDLFPSAADVNYFNTFIRKVENLKLEEPNLLSCLLDTEHVLTEMKTARFGEIHTFAIKLEKTISDVLGIYDKNLLHIDLCYNLTKASITRDIKDDLLRAVYAFSSISEIAPNTYIQNFIENFKRRYGDGRVPLKYFLDRDLGINLFFENSTYSSDEATLFKGIDLEFKAMGSKSSPVLPNMPNDLLQSILQGEAIDLSKFNHNGVVDNNIISCAFSFADNVLNKNSPILMKSIGFNGFSNILGRFNYLNEEFLRFHSELENLEDGFLNKGDTEIIDILHFPSIKTSNVVVAHKNREEGISIFSNYPGKAGINFDELYLEVKNDELILRSSSSGKRIIPKLSNAHNYLKTDSCQIYSLLALIGLQENNFKQLPIWSLLEILGTFPRIQYKNIVLIPRTWIIPLEVRRLEESRILDFFEGQNLPTLFYLIDPAENNTILINLRYRASRTIFINAMQKHKKTAIQECIWDFKGDHKKIFELYFCFTKSN